MITDVCVNRPGGFELTSRLIDLVKLPEGSKILDVGCGSGATVEYLHSEYGYRSFGMDKNIREAEGNTRQPLVQGIGSKLPFDDRYFDGLLCECSFSLFDTPEASLLEFARVLKDGGCLFMSDLYARQKGGSMDNPAVKYLYTKEKLWSMLIKSGFQPNVFEDQTFWMKTLLAQKMMDGGQAALDKLFAGEYGRLKAMGCGYYILTAHTLIY